MALDLKVSPKKQKTQPCAQVAKQDRISNMSKSDKSSDSKKAKTFPCLSCHKSFSTEVDLKAHLVRHVTQHPFVCLACGKGFKYEHSLNFHVKSYHGIEGSNSLKCIGKKQCSVKMECGESQANSRVRDNNNNSELFMDESSCEDGNSDNSSCNNNNNSSNSSNGFDMGFPPNFAPRSIQIKSEKVLVTLLEGVHASSDQTYILYKCCLCGFAFPCLEPVLVHIQTVHSNHNTFTCDKCGATFKWRSELQLHDQLHKAMDNQGKSGPLLPSFHQPNMVLLNPYFGDSPGDNNNGNEPFESQGLNLTMSLSSDKHEKRNQKEEVKRKEKPLPTTVKPTEVSVKAENLSLNKGTSPGFATNVTTTVPTAPVGDIEETAPGQFKCRFCEKTFDRIFSVHRHERVHTGYKPCICKVCGRGFSEKRNLRHHIIRFHSDGSGRELLKRARKDKTLAATTKQLAASVLKKAALKLLNANDAEAEIKLNQNATNRLEEVLPVEVQKESVATFAAEDLEAASLPNEETRETFNPDQGSSSSSRRRKSKPSKKVVLNSVNHMDVSENEEEKLPENDSKVVKEESTLSNHGKDGNISSDSNGGDVSESSDNKLRCHGAFFSSYSPRLGIVEKPIKRNEACRPLIGPDGKYLYPCGYCQKTFCSLSDLNRHMNFHEDVRPFKCEYCDYQSRTNSQLKVHMMRHAGIKQYLCQICNYNGVTQSDLNRHCKTRSHVLRSANVCPLCSLGFSTRTLLEDHLVKFHDTSSSAAATLSQQGSDHGDREKALSNKHHHDIGLNDKLVVAV